MSRAAVDHELQEVLSEGNVFRIAGRQPVDAGIRSDRRRLFRFASRVFRFVACALSDEHRHKVQHRPFHDLRTRSLSTETVFVQNHEEHTVVRVFQKSNVEHAKQIVHFDGVFCRLYVSFHGETGPDEFFPKNSETRLRSRHLRDWRHNLVFRFKDFLGPVVSAM